jgi:hypothetical protein
VWRLTQSLGLSWPLPWLPLGRRPGIAPEKLLRAMLLQVLYSIHDITLWIYFIYSYFSRTKLNQSSPQDKLSRLMKMVVATSKTCAVAFFFQSITYKKQVPQD